MSIVIRFKSLLLELSSYQRVLVGQRLHAILLTSTTMEAHGVSILTLHGSLSVQLSLALTFTSTTWVEAEDELDTK